MLIDNKQCISFLKDELNKKRDLQIIVHGDSMLPTLKNGDMVILQRCYEYKIGDIIAYSYFKNEKITIFIHRIIFLRNDYILAKGDNNKFIDPIKIKKKDILGKVSLA